MRYKIYDNEGQTIDRYSVLFSNGDAIGMSDNPRHPQGFYQHESGIDYSADHSNLGKRITIKALPDDCRELLAGELRAMRKDRHERNTTILVSFGTPQPFSK